MSCSVNAEIADVDLPGYFLSLLRIFFKNYTTMATALTQDDFNRLTSQLAASSVSRNIAMAGLISSNAQFMRSAANADSNIRLSKSQYFLPSELTATRAIDNTVDQNHRSGLPASQRDTNPLRSIDNTVDQNHRSGLPASQRDTNPLRSNTRLRAKIAADPGHPLRGVTVFGLGHHEQTPERIDELNASHRTRGREIRMLKKQLPHMTTTSAPKMTRWNRKLSGSLIPSLYTALLLKATSEKAKYHSRLPSQIHSPLGMVWLIHHHRTINFVFGLTNMARLTITKSSV